MKGSTRIRDCYLCNNTGECSKCKYPDIVHFLMECSYCYGSRKCHHCEDEKYGQTSRHNFDVGDHSSLVENEDLCLKQIWKNLIKKIAMALRHNLKKHHK